MLYAVAVIVLNLEWREMVRMGQFAMVGMLLILLDFIPLVVGLGESQGSFQSKFVKIALPIWLVMLVVGIILLLIP
jgi:uncharacterized membrane protein YozB (DUF420 family)